MQVVFVVQILQTLILLTVSVGCSCEEYYDESKEFDSNDSKEVGTGTEGTEATTIGLEAVEVRSDEVLDPELGLSTGMPIEKITQDYIPENSTIIINLANISFVKSSEETGMLNFNFNEFNSTEKANSLTVTQAPENVSTIPVPVTSTISDKDKMSLNITTIINIEELPKPRARLISKPNRTRVIKPEYENQKLHLERKSGESEDLQNTHSTYPYTVSIQRKGSHFATGALLNRRWIISTAYDFFNVRETIKLFRARLGTINCKKGGLIVPLKGIEIHPLYKYGNPTLDLSLIRTGHQVNYSEAVKPILLSKVTAKILNAKFLTTYWPRLIVKGQVLPGSANEREKHTSMRMSIQSLIPWETCLAQLETMGVKLTGANFCLKSVESHHSRCLPDAGAPVVAEDGLWGITSGWTSEQCYTTPSPTIFTRVAAPRVISWIEKHIN